MNEILFEVAGLLVEKDSAHPLISSGDITKIEKRLHELLDSFQTKDTYYSTNHIRGGPQNLPFCTFTQTNLSSQHLILFFDFSFKDPLLYIIDKKTGEARNFVDISSLKLFANDIVFENVKNHAHYNLNMSRLYKNVENIYDFSRNFQKAKKQHKAMFSQEKSLRFSLKL